MDWLDESELRIGLGCMRLSTDADHDSERGLETIAAAISSGITVFDTAHAYGLDDAELGHNERLLAQALSHSDAATSARIVTKGGMSRAGGGWVPDGRATSIRHDCEASLVALDGLPVDLYLLHAPDPRVPWRTSVRALAKLVDERLVRRVGVSNVNRRQLDEALDLAPIAAVQVSLSPFDVTAVRGGVVARCTELGLAVMAHSPLGGVRRAASLTRNAAVRDVAAEIDATPAEVALAWLLTLSPSIVVIPGARRPESASSAAAAAGISLNSEQQQQLSEAFGLTAAPKPTSSKPSAVRREVVVVMGVPGAGKSRIAADYAGRGFERLNRDERGGSLKALAAELDARLADGATRIVLDNTYLTRASRSYVVESAARHAARAACIWIDVSLEHAQINMVERLLDRFGALPSPEELRAASRKEPWLLSPTAQMRTLRELEPPTADEGWDDLTHLPFVRERVATANKHAVFVAAAAMTSPGWERAVLDVDPAAPHLVFEWRADAAADVLAPLEAELRRLVTGPVGSAVCAHPAGPPICWCRPPLPGLPLAFARAHGCDAAGSTLIGCKPTHRRLAASIGARYADVVPST